MPFDWIRDELDTLKGQNLLRSRRVVRGLSGGWCEVNGRRLLDFASNDYLGLAADLRLIAAARAALTESGAGSRASALVVGRGPWHERLERRLAEFEGTEAALLFPTGYAANVGAIAALAGPGDVVCSDRLNHASLIDGCRLSGAKVRVYSHCDASAVDRELSQAALREGEAPAEPRSRVDLPQGTARREPRPPVLESSGHRSRRLIVTDSLFSMDGDPAPLRELCDVSARHGAMLLVDEAHATGVLGEHGRGLTEHCGVEDRPLVKVGTLSKAIGSQGGFVAGPRVVIDWLFNRARTQMFSTALAPSACAAALAAIDLIEREPERRRTVLAHAARLRTTLAEADMALPGGGIGPIVPVVLGDPDRTMRAARQLEERGFLVGAIRPPSVPQGTSRLRISLSAAHAAKDVEALGVAVIEVTSQ